MPDEATTEALIAYAATIRQDRNANRSLAGDGTALELLLAPRMQALIEQLLAARMPLAPSVLPEYRRPGIGRPDLAFKRAGQPARAFIELKQPETSLDPRRLRGHDSDQFKRFSELPLWGFCNFHSIHLYRRGELREQAVLLPASVLDPGTSDQTASRLIRRHDAGPFLNILETLALAAPMAPRDAPQVAEFLAQAARLVRGVVVDQCRAGAPQALSDIRAEFRETLFAHAASGGYDVADEDALFGNAFAQTLAFGLLLAREAGAGDVDRDAYRVLPAGGYPLLRATLRALTQDEILDLLGAAFDVLQDVVNTVNRDLLKPRQGRDPILYFYEDFLGVFDPAAKKKNGVFFTPVPVVRFMVAGTERALSGPLGTQGLLDPNVLLLDPACGTGTFLIAAASAAAEAVRERYGEGAVAQEMAALAARLHGFEVLVGPYTVAHYRMLREMAASNVVPTTRLPIFLADTLAAPAGAAGVVAHLGFLAAPIVEERRGADALKRQTPILAIFGNPPYRRLAEGEDRTVFSGWAEPLWNDLKQAVQNAGWGRELNTFPELSVAFWRWCLWKLFESEGAPGRGVVCLITNRTFLAGHPFAGLRRMLRRRFDAIDIVDLRGDSRGARPAGIGAEENVFEIQVGVCILTAVASGAPRQAGTEAKVRYADVWRHGAFTASDKLALLDTARVDPATLTFAEIERRDMDDFVPAAFEGLDWPALPEAFAYRGYGVKTQHDDIAYGFSKAALLGNIRAFEAERDADRAAEIFKNSRKNKATGAQAVAVSAADAREISFRPLDRRWLYYDSRFVDEMARRPISAWGTENRCLYALPSGTGAGPAVWLHGLLPDYHAFRGSYGGYAFPLFDRRHGASAHNLNPALLDGLTSLYGQTVTPDAVFDAIAALLSATSYTRRFAWDLEEAFAHIPFPAEAVVFAEAARVGGEIRALECFIREPEREYRGARLLGRASGVILAAPPQRNAFLEDGSGRGFIPLQEDQSLRLAGVSRPAFEFAVSGYRVLYRWLAARNGEAIDAALQRGILDIVWRIEELLHWFDAADAVLERALVRPVTRAELSLANPGTAPAVGLEDSDDEQPESPA
jgi:hypothetical protein